MSELEDKLRGVTLSFTNRVLYFPCRSNRPQTEYPNHMWWRFKKPKTNTLYIPVLDKSYKDYMSNLYNAVTEQNISYDKIDREDKILLGKIYTKYRMIIKSKQINTW